METKSRKKGKILFKIVSLCLCLVLIAVLSFFVFYFSVSSGVRLNEKALAIAGNGNITIYSNSGSEIDAKFNSSNSKIKVEDLNPYTINAFISMEDKRFFKHNGIDLIRIAGALINNLKSGSAKQGGSTISQQLVKNSQLTQEKTYTRKIKEIKLALELEKKYSKNEILEMYLNTIYFGNGCYGIEDASQFYFNKHASMLTLNESALLVAIINAPSVYNPITNYDKAIERKNLVLKNMLEDGKISQDEYDANVNSGIKIYEGTTTNCYGQAVIEEVCDILGVSENNLINMNLKIYTYLDDSLQNKIKEQIASKSYTPQTDGKTPTLSSIVIDNKTGGIVAFATNGRQNPNTIYSQPGSAIKPLLVYAPAIEYGVISPATKILDEPININGYSPQNAGKTYHGYVSARTALQNSLNIPAVKVLSYTGIEKSINFAKKLGIEFESTDKNFAIALGGFSKGTNITKLANAYMTFAQNGIYSPAKFVSRIENGNGETIYSHNKQTTQVMKDSTAYLITDMLIDTTKHGTASRLSDFNFEIASKTGTVGKVNSTDNTDAWSVSYTSRHTMVTHINTNESVKSMPSSVNGSTYPTLFNKGIISYLYKSSKPENFRQPSSVVLKDIDLISYQNNIVELAGNNLEERFRKTEYFDVVNLPKSSSRESLKTPEISVYMFDNEFPLIKFNSQKNATYILLRDNGGGFVNLSNFTGTGDAIEFKDSQVKENNVYTYKLKAVLDEDEATSNEMKIFYKSS